MKEFFLCMLFIAAGVVFVVTLVTRRQELLPLGFVLLIVGQFLSRRL